MDIMKLFEDYLPVWAHEKHQPIPKQENADRWALAWKDFLNEYLSEKYSEIAEEYKNMQFKTYGDVKKEQKRLNQEKSENKVDENIVESPLETKEDNDLEESEWDKVRKLLGK